MTLLAEVVSLGSNPRQGKVISSDADNCSTVRNLLCSCCFTRFAQSVLTVVSCEAVIVDRQ